ncbi:MAG: hypothetical protein ACRCTJ_00145 [Brevinema sp.]
MLSVFTGCSNKSIAAPNSQHIVNFGTTPSFESLIPTSDYVIYFDPATLPTLYIAIHMLTHNKSSFFYTRRKETLKTDHIPSHVTMIPDENSLSNKIAELNHINPNSTFTFYVNDHYFHKIHRFFYSQGIQAERIRSILISDGTVTYTHFSLYYEIDKSFKKWKNDIKQFNQKIALSTSLRHPIFKLIKKILKINKISYLVAPDADKNIEHWLQWPELLYTKDQDLSEHLKYSNAKYYKIDPYLFLQSLPIEKHLQFENMIGLNKVWTNGEDGGTLNNQTIKQALDASLKPNIIIIGRNPFGKHMNDFITSTKKYYGDDYDYFFKAHPSVPSTPEDKSIVVLPYRVPMEAVLWAYGDKISILGGHESTIFLSAPTKIKKFLFPKEDQTPLSVENMVKPIGKMHELGLLGDLIFIE